MHKTKSYFDPPTRTFPYKIPWRLNALSVPRRYNYVTSDGMPEYTDRGVRKSALKAQLKERIKEISWPYIRRLLYVKRIYGKKFSPDRLSRIDRMIEAANSTMYSKLAKCMITLKKPDARKETKKKRGWSESEWKKHMEYISVVAAPKKEFQPPPVVRGKSAPIENLLPRIKILLSKPDFKLYKRLSQEEWYRNPEKVAPNALKYVLTDRMKILASPRVIPQS